jgi:hypothetical protein
MKCEVQTGPVNVFLKGPSHMRLVGLFRSWQERASIREDGSAIVADQ